MTFIAHWEKLDDSLAFRFARGHSFELTNGKCHAFSF